jgi:type IV secretory pathway TrbD component
VEPRAAERRDPGIAAAISAVVPGAGLLYAGSPRVAAVLLVSEAVLFALGWWIVLFPLHIWQIALAAGTAFDRSERFHDALETRSAVNASETT